MTLKRRNAPSSLQRPPFWDGAPIHLHHPRSADGGAKPNVSKQAPLVIVIGMPRSGTTWLGRILDSHPETLLRHEPDTIDRGAYSFIPDGTTGAETAREHLDRLATNRSLKACGSRPFFPKAYRGWVSQTARNAIVAGGKLCETLGATPGRILSVPDLAERYVPVIKSVSLGRAQLWRAARPDATHLHLLRHPCGQIHSTLRGKAHGHLPPEVFLDFAECAMGRYYGLTRSYLADLSLPRQLAWRWVVFTQRAIEAGIPVIPYEKLCSDPELWTSWCLQLSGLSLTEQTRRFLRTSTAGAGRYFQTRRDPVRAATAWRDTFAGADEVIEVVRATEMSSYLDILTPEPNASKSFTIVNDMDEC